jgi:hypothetical protein
LDVLSRDALCRLRTAFQELYEGRATRSLVSNIGKTVFTKAISEIALLTVGDREEPSRAITPVVATRGGVVIEWTRNSEGWIECAELLDGLVGAGHQHLACSPSGDLEIEVDFQETGAEQRLAILNRDLE